MDLLEYMRSQNNMTQAEWERTFEDEAREILVLLAGGGGAGKRNGFWAQPADDASGLQIVMIAVKVLI